MMRASPDETGRTNGADDMKTPAHYFVPERTAPGSGNYAPCCKAPQSAHPAYPVSELDQKVTVRVRLNRNVRTFGRTVVAKGTELDATFYLFEGHVVVSEGRWGTNSLGQFAELEKTVLGRVVLPVLTLPTVDGSGIHVETADVVA